MSSSAVGHRIEGDSSGGSDGIAGFGRMAVTVRLADVDGGTSLDYVADAAVGGKIARIGSRFVQAAATRFADAFFRRFRAFAAPSRPDEATGRRDRSLNSIERRASPVRPDAAAARRHGQGRQTGI